jgi:hypothetical protein
MLTLSRGGSRISSYGGGAHLKKLRRAEGSAKIFGVFRVENHDFTRKKSYFFQFGSAPAFGALVHPNICAVRVVQSLVFFVVICKSLLDLLSFFILVKYSRIVCPSLMSTF